MVEAEITCECPSIHLSDLGISLSKGMVVYIDAMKAQRSSDLARAQASAGVRVTYVRRYRERRAQPPQQPVSPTPAAVIPTVPASGANPELDAEALAERVVDLLTPKLQKMLKSVLDDLPVGMGFQRTLSLQGGENGPLSMGTLPPIDSDIPVFIPSKVGSDGLKPVSVESSVGEDTGLSDALTALKAARKSEKS